MKIAVLGAGFCGMAVAWNLLQRAGIDVTLFDPRPIATGTSGIAAGLLHPYAGAHSKLNWRALEGMVATRKLFRVAEQAHGKTVAYPQGMLRLAISPLQTKDFTSNANLYTDIHLSTEKECHDFSKLITPHPGIYIASAITVDCESYLHGLWQACARRGALFEQKAINSIEELSHFDSIIVTMGAHTTDLPELKHLAIHGTKGQVLEYAWPDKWESMPSPVNSQAYLIMNPTKNSCIVGATYEKQFSDGMLPDKQAAIFEILPKVRPFFPKIDELKLINCRAGIRAGTPDRKPLVAQISEKCWILSGMGSKGLLYHALYAEELVKKLLL